MKKRFIIIIDDLKHAQSLVQYAAEWALQETAELLILYETIPILPSLAERDDRDAIIKSTNKKDLEEIQTAFQSCLPKALKVNYQVDELPLVITLQQLVSEDYEDLIFIGIKKVGWLEQLFLGSKAIHVIEKIPHVVVALPEEVNKYVHEKVYVAVSTQQPINIIELNHLLKFIQSANTEIIFFYFAKKDEDTKAEEKYLKELKELFADRFSTSYVIYEGKNPFEDIKKVINDKIDEILVVQKGSRLLMDRLFRKFLVNKLVLEGQTPLVVLPSI